ncbi:MAG: amidohydrolase family protein [Acidobacteria bacterium]|nr:amidohydrolase family protein [Acidobacteriota bacterium]
MRNGFPIYDTHTHIGRARHSGMRFTAEDMLRSMDGYGVERAVLIPYPVVEDHRAAHDEIGAAVAAHPDRFTGAICLNPFIPEQEFRDEAARCVEKLGLRALKLQPQYQPLNPVSPRSDFFFETAARHRLPIIAHTGSGVPFSLPSLFIAPARRFPEATIVLGHAGGPTYALEAIVAASVCENIYIELSSLMPHHVLEVLAHVPPTRLMAGSDLPASLSTEIGKILDLPVEDTVKRAILWETPRRVFDGA